LNDLIITQKGIVIQDIHEGLDFSMDSSGEISLGLYSVQFSKDGREIVAGSNQSSIYVYDLEANRTNLCLQAHNVCYFLLLLVCFGSKCCSFSASTC
jgi:WD40 repeat protein